ncbi:MAG: response regulator transcription factor [Propionibacterium sp.]|nr:response regulator transcription factor [Propionibacterium sp.]
MQRLLPGTLEADDLQVVITCGSGEAAIASEADVDVWLVDLRMPGIDGRETARRLRMQQPEVKVVLLTSFGDHKLAETLEAGASAYLHKDAAPEQLRRAIRCVMDGYTVVAPGILPDALRTHGTPELDLVHADDVDRRIMALMSAGQTYEEIAEDVQMSVSGTKKRAARLMALAGVGSRSQLVAKLHGLHA